MPAGIFMIKPASSLCNMRCKYCFYIDEASHRKVASYGVMSEDTLEIIVRKAMAFSTGSCTFIFQGGEPTLAGLPFYEKLIEFQKRYRPQSLQVFNSLQTNGYAIDEAWAKFLANHHFLVGLSMDGDANAHNLHRVDATGAGTYHRVLRAAKLFDQFGVDYNILTVVTGNTARHIGRIYDHYRKNGFQFLQFIPCLDPINAVSGAQPFSLKPDTFSYMLRTLFDRWYRDYQNGNPVSIRYFDNLLIILLGQQPESCAMNGYCTANCVIEADGSVYPCDFYMLDAWKLGNIHDNAIETMLQSPNALRFMRSSIGHSEKCRACRYFTLCRGGCRREREMATDTSINYYCTAYQEFFDHAISRLIEIARNYQRR